MTKEEFFNGIKRKSEENRLKEMVEAIDPEEMVVAMSEEMQES